MDTDSKDNTKDETGRTYHHHHSHHHHHHHHHSSNINTSNTLVGMIKRYIEAKKEEKKYKDATSKYRTHMRERRLRKKLYESLVLILTLFVLVIVGMGVIYAYFIDK